MIFVRQNQNLNEIVEEIRKMAENGNVEILKDDCISFKAKIAKGKRINFCIQVKGIIIEGKSITLGNYYKNIKTEKEDVFGDGELLTTRIYADVIEYDHLRLDKTSLYIREMDIDWDNHLSFELVA